MITINSLHMKVLCLLIIVIMMFSGTSLAFAQEYLEVKPAFVKDHSDACSKLYGEFPSKDPISGYLTHANVIDVREINSNFTRTAMIDYDGTKLVTSINTSNLTDFPNNLSSPYSVEYDYPLHKLSSVNYTVGERYYFVTAISNIGNKSVDITQFPTVPLGFELKYPNGTAVEGIGSSSLSEGGSMEMADYIGPLKLEPAKSIVENEELLFRSTNTNLASSIIPGLYKLTADGEILGDVNGTCTRVFLWSQPIDVTILPEEKLPEFPFAIPVMLIGIVSVIAFYRVKFRN